MAEKLSFLKASMCGLWGKIYFEKEVPLEDLLHPIESLYHRGPDGYGWYHDGQVALVHRRLSIIDLTGGTQPLRSFDKNVWGIVNGELYDYKEKRQSMQKEGITFETHSDSEVLLNLFVSEGEASFEKISGEYAFIFYDKNHQKIYFGRDPHGVKPLFYKLDREGLTLSSEMKALSSEPIELSESYLKSFIARLMIPPETSLKGVVHALPGRVYTLDLKTKKLTWKLINKLPLSQPRTLNQKDSVGLLESALLESIKSRLVADTEIGCYLSGGVDSALIAAMAAKLGAKPKAFTVGFSDRDLDESGRAAMVAKHLGLEHSVVSLSGKNFFPSLVKSIVAFEHPIANPHGAAKNILAEHAGKKVKVILSGEGADEWLGGYAYFRIKKLREFLGRRPEFSADVLKQYVEMESQINMNSLDGSSTQNDLLVKAFFDDMSVALSGRLMKHRMFRYLTRDGLDPLLTTKMKTLRTYFDEEFSQSPAELSSFDLNSWVGLRTDFLQYIMANVGDRQEMSHSIEGRTPFLDPRLTRVMGNIPQKYLIHGLTEKWALREVAKKYLPPEIYDHHKHPFFAPMKYLYTKTVSDGMQEYIKVAEANTPYLNWKNIHRLLDEEKLGSKSPLKDTAISMKLILFSTGVLLTELRKNTRPQISMNDIRPYRKVD